MPKQNSKALSQQELIDAFQSLGKIGEEILLPQSFTADTLKRGGKKKDEITSYLHRYDFGSFFLSLVYTPERSDLTSAPSTLEVRISLDKSEQLFFFMPYDVIPFINPQDMICRYFPYIESPARMASCYRDLVESLVPYLADFSRIANDDSLRTRAYQGIRDEMTRCYGEAIDRPSGKGHDYDQALLSLRFFHFIKWKSSFYSSMEYAEFLKGNPAYLSTIAFRGARPDYIKHLALSTAGKATLDFLPVRPASASLPAMADASKKSRTVGVLAITVLLLLPLIAAVLGGLYYAIASLVGADSLYYSALSFEAFASNFLWIAVATVSLSLVIYPITLRLFFKKRYRLLAPYSRMASWQQGASKTKRTAYFMVAAALVFTVFSACRGVHLTKEAILSQNGMIPVAPDSHRYEEIVKVEEISRKDGSFYYIMTFKNEDIWSFEHLMDDKANSREIADILKPFLEEHGITVEKDQTNEDQSEKNQNQNTTNQA